MDFDKGSRLDRLYSGTGSLLVYFKAEAHLSRRRTYVTSRDFNDRVHVLFLEILSDSGKTLFDISVNTGQICMRFEADTPQKLLKYAHLTKFPDKKLI